MRAGVTAGVTTGHESREAGALLTVTAAAATSRQVTGVTDPQQNGIPDYRDIQYLTARTAVMPGGHPVIADVALVVTALGVVGAVFGLRQSYRERLRQFEAMYVNRYWSLLDLLSLDALKGSDPKVISNSDERAIRAYIRLCEDELEMREAGYIGDSTYAVWADGICEQFKQSMFARIWEQVQAERTFPYDHLARLLKDGQNYEPCELRPWQRRLRGLAGPRGV